MSNIEKIDSLGFTKEGKPIYRLLTGVDDKNFCLKVSEALMSGYELYGSPAITFNGQNNIVAQAIIYKGWKDL